MHKEWSLKHMRIYSLIMIALCSAGAGAVLGLSVKSWWYMQSCVLCARPRTQGQCVNFLHILCSTVHKQNT